MLFHQRHLGLDRRGDVGRHQPGRAAADHHQVAVKLLRPRPAGVDAPRPHHIRQLLGHQRKHAQQHQRAQQPRRDDARQAADAGQLGAGVHVHRRAGQHAQLADPVERGRAHRRQPHRQVDDEERHHRHQPQGEQVETALARNAGVQRGQPVAEALLHPGPQQPAAGQEGQRRADAGGERHDQQPPAQAEDGAAGQGHHRRARQAERGDGHIGGEEQQCCRHRLRRAPRLQVSLAGLDGRQLQVLPQVQRHEGAHQDQKAQRHTPAFVPLHAPSSLF